MSALSSFEIHRLVDRLYARIDKADCRVTYARGTVTTVVPGGAIDGNDIAEVTIDGNDIRSPYLASYAPVEGDYVEVKFQDYAPLILGKVVGFPTGGL